MSVSRTAPVIEVPFTPQPEFFTPGAAAPRCGPTQLCLDLRDSASGARGRHAGFSHHRRCDHRLRINVMIGTRVLSTSDAFNIAAGSRPASGPCLIQCGPRSHYQRPRPRSGAAAPPQTSIAVRSARPATPVMPATAAKPQIPIEAAAANSPASDITGSIPPRSEPAETPVRRSTAAGPNPPVQPNRATTAPVSELTGSIFSHPESQPNVEPDWKQNPPRRGVTALTR